MTKGTPTVTWSPGGGRVDYRSAPGLRIPAAAGRPAVLAARLGYATRAWLADLRGNVLVLGCDGRLDDANVPQMVLEAASRAGLLRDQAGAGADR